MSDNKLIAVVCCVAIAGCSTCHVSQDRRDIELERIKAEERRQILTPLEKP